MRAFLNRLYTYSGYSAAGFIVAICTLVMLQVFLNIINRLTLWLYDVTIGNIPSYTALTGYCLAAASFLALAYTFRQGEHIRVTLLFQYMPPLLKKICDLLSLTIACCLSSYLTYYMAALVHESYIYNDVTTGIVVIPLWILQAFLLCGLSIFTLALWDDCICFLSGRRLSYQKNKHFLSSETKTPKTRGS